MKMKTMTKSIKKLKCKNKLIIIISALFIFLVLFASFVFPQCPSTMYNSNELRSRLRIVILALLSAPSLDTGTANEIFDLLQFYKNEKDKPSITDCGVVGSSSGEQISAIIEKITECNDGIDNDGDRKADFPDDAGCTGLIDNDETNCGDNKCEGPETCSSCSSDCGKCPSPGIGILFMGGGGANAISFKDNGDVILKGKLSQGTTPAADNTQDEFIFRDNSGGNIAIINLITGNMAIKGALKEKQAALANPPTNDFIIKDSNGNIVSYIDEQGNFYLKGILTQNGNP